MTPKNLHHYLFTLILSLGSEYPKKHGDWVKLELSEDRFLSVDTWNGSIVLKQGTGYYNQWKGFYGKPLINYGWDFGRYHQSAPLEDLYKLKWLLEELQVKKLQEMLV